MRGTRRPKRRGKSGGTGPATDRPRDRLGLGPSHKARSRGARPGARDRRRLADPWQGGTRPRNARSGGDLAEPNEPPRSGPGCLQGEGGDVGRSVLNRRAIQNAAGVGVACIAATALRATYRPVKVETGYGWGERIRTSDWQIQRLAPVLPGGSSTSLVGIRPRVLRTHPEPASSRHFGSNFGCRRRQDSVGNRS